MEAQAKRYMVVIQLAGNRAEVMEKARDSVPKIKTLIEQYSNNECQLAFTTSDGSTFAYLLKTKTPIHVVRKALYGELDSSRGPSMLLASDKFLGLEIGESTDGRGLSRAWTWLEHHK